MLFSRLLCGLAAIVTVNALSTHRSNLAVAEAGAVERGVGEDTPRKEYKYTFDELRPGKGSNPQPYFKFVFFLKKKPDVTEAFFHEHWKTMHADLTITAKKFGIRVSRYMQFHQDSNSKKAAQPIVDLSKGLMQFLPYDGYTEMHCPDVATFNEYVTSVLNDKAVNEDMATFVDVKEGLKFMAGYDNLIFGEGVHQEKGKDGIMPKDKRLNN